MHITILLFILLGLYSTLYGLVLETDNFFFKPISFLSLFCQLVALPTLPYIINSGHVYPLVLSEGGYLLSLVLLGCQVGGRIGRPELTVDSKWYTFMRLRMKGHDSVGFPDIVLSSL